MHMTPMKAGVTIGQVHLMLTSLLDAAARAGPVDGNHDEDIVGYVAQRLLVPAMEHLGHVERVTTVQTNEERARSFAADFIVITNTSIQVTELTRLTWVQATDPVDDKLGRLPIDISSGLRKACVQGAKELAAMEPELVSAIRNRVRLPAKYNESTLAMKFTLHMLLRMLAPIVNSRMKACSLYCSVASVHDVVLANNPRSPIMIVLEDQHPAKRINLSDEQVFFSAKDFRISLRSDVVGKKVCWPKKGGKKVCCCFSSFNKCVGNAFTTQKGMCGKKKRYL